MQLEFQLDEGVDLPTKANPTDAGFDLKWNGKFKKQPTSTLFRTGVRVAIPENHVGLLCARSSIGKYNHRLRNGVGIIDSGYRGELMVSLEDLDGDGDRYRPGDRIAQLVVVPCPQFEPVAVGALPASVRGDGGFGSSGRA